MRDLLSMLPAPLPLFILLEIPDLKALYAALLASPTFYAAWRLDSFKIVQAVAPRTWRHFREEIVMYVVHQNRIANKLEKHCRLDYDGYVDLTPKNLNCVLKGIGSGLWFHIVARFVVIHDRASSICQLQKEQESPLRY